MDDLNLQDSSFLLLGQIVFSMVAVIISILFAAVF